MPAKGERKYRVWWPSMLMLDVMAMSPQDAHAKLVSQTEVSVVGAGVTFVARTGCPPTMPRAGLKPRGRCLCWKPPLIPKGSPDA